MQVVWAGLIWLRDGVVWTNLAQDRDQWMVFMNTAMNLQVP
jgi:hypothetical protein